MNLGKEEDNDHDQDSLKKAFWHIWSWSSDKSVSGKEKDDDHDQDFIKKDLLHIWSWSSDKSSSVMDLEVSNYDSRSSLASRNRISGTPLENY